MSARTESWLRKTNAKVCANAADIPADVQHGSGGRCHGCLYRVFETARGKSGALRFVTHLSLQIVASAAAKDTLRKAQKSWHQGDPYAVPKSWVQIIVWRLHSAVVAALNVTRHALLVPAVVDLKACRELGAATNIVTVAPDPSAMTSSAVIPPIPVSNRLDHVPLPLLSKASLALKTRPAAPVPARSSISFGRRRKHE